MAEDLEIRCKLGFFLHIPFPSWDIFRLFPWSDEILQGMLGKPELMSIFYFNLLTFSINDTPLVSHIGK